jgi:glyoxylase I family protein
MIVPAAVRSRLMHFGICVADLSQSVAFYCEGLGFSDVAAFEVGIDYESVMGVFGGLKVQSRFISKDGFSIELLAFDSPGHLGYATVRPMNQLGLTHLCLSVDDVDCAIARVESFGGLIVPGTRKRIEKDAGWYQDVVFCTDPNGVRLELTTITGWGLGAED